MTRVRSARVRSPMGAGRLRGQAAVLTALGLFATVVFAALATNLGSLVNEKVRMQDAADLGAYAGAFQQASRMNSIARLNEAIQNVASYCRARLTERRFPGPSVKVWNQCFPEGPPPNPTDYNLDKLPRPGQISALPPVGHVLWPPMPKPPGNECDHNRDQRAHELIDWCEKSIQYYAAIIYDLNDYDMAYHAESASPDHPVHLAGWRMMGIFRAVKNTVGKNYPKASVEMMDASESSPVFRGRFYQGGVTMTEENPVPQYERPGGPSMLPLVRTPMYFNYVYKCCSRTKECGPKWCGFRRVVFPYVGTVNEGTNMARREFATVFSYNVPKGYVYMPVRSWGNPRRHDVPLLDNPGRGDDSTYFGGINTWNDLRAVAVAKPYEGYIGPDPNTMLAEYGVNEDYVPPILETGSAIEGRPWPPHGVYTAVGTEALLDDGMVPFDTYRARMAGFREPLYPTSTGGTMLDVLVDHARKSPISADNPDTDYSHTSH